MNITQLQYFQAVCNFGSTIKAAEALYVSQPSVSNALNKLQGELNLRLFEKCGNRLVLTEEGRLFRDRAEKVLFDLDELNLEIRRISDKNVVSFSIPPVGSTAISLAFLKFRDEHPEIRISAYEDSQHEALSLLESGQRDFAITIIDNANIKYIDELGAIPLGYLDLKFCVNNQNPLSRLEEVHVDQIGRSPLVIMKGDYYQNAILTGIFRRSGIEPNIVLYATQFPTLRKYVNLGLASGFAFGSTLESKDYAKYIDFIPKITATIGIVYRKSSYRRPCTRNLIDTIAQSINPSKELYSF